MSVQGPPKGASIGLVTGSARRWRFRLSHEGSNNITGMVVWFEIGYTTSTADEVNQVLLRKSSTVSGEITIVDAANGLVDVFMVEEDTYGADAPLSACGSNYRWVMWLGVGGKPYACNTPGQFTVTAGVGPGTIPT